VIISSPSGAGKTTLARMLMERHPSFCASISHTTRAPRGDEQHGREYYFVDDAGFDRMLETEQFVEWAPVHTHRYGTSKDELNRIFAAGNNVLLDIDWQGTQQILKCYPDATAVFVLPPSMKELARRLRGRKTDDEAEIRVRLANARRELENYGLYGHLIINDDLEQTYADLEGIACGSGPIRAAATVVDVERLLQEVVE
jgi:guanylate kinase